MAAKLIKFLGGLALALFCAYVTLAGVRVYQERNMAAISRMYRVRADIALIDKSITNYHQRVGHFPQSIRDLVNIEMESIPNDPWDIEYQLMPIKNIQSVKVYSLGLDQKPGGVGLCTDFDQTTNWEIVLKEIQDHRCAA